MVTAYPLPCITECNKGTKPEADSCGLGKVFRSGRWTQLTFTFQHGQSCGANLSTVITAEKVNWQYILQLTPFTSVVYMQQGRAEGVPRLGLNLVSLKLGYYQSCLANIEKVPFESGNGCLMESCAM